jgi:uncharacterized protein (TIGR00251 family)
VPFDFIRPYPDGVELLVKAKPRSAKTRLLGEREGALEVQLSAPPVDGAANEALVELIADWVGVPKRQVNLVSGEKARLKRVRVTGVSVSQIEALSLTLPR